MRQRGLSPPAGFAERLISSLNPQHEFSRGGRRV